MKKTHVGIALDRSGSMDSIRRQTVDAYNSLIAKIREMASPDHDVRVSFWTFGSTTTNIYKNRDVRQLENLSLSAYNPSGSTRLYGTVVDMVGEMKAFPDSEESAYLILVVTDGEDTTYDSPGSMKKSIKDVDATGKWTFGFQVPSSLCKGFMSASGLSSDFVFGWDSSGKGMVAASAANNEAVSTYFAARAAGATRTSSLYVQASLSNVARDTIEALEDLTNRFKVYRAANDTTTLAVGEKALGAYVNGSVYYKLKKLETIQGHKDVIIKPKDKNKLYGGKKARSVLGLPDSDAKVKPGDFGIYEVFIKSTAPNRKIMAGDIVIVDTQKDNPDTPTWDYQSI